MARHFEHLKFRSQKISRSRLFDEEICFGRFHFEFESEVPKKFTIRNHRCRRGVTTNLAIEAALDFGHVLDVIDVTVSE